MLLTQLSTISKVVIAFKMLLFIDFFSLNRFKYYLILSMASIIAFVTILEDPENDSK